MNVPRYIVHLTPQQREALQQLVRAGKTSAQQLIHAHILLKADRSQPGPYLTEQQIGESVGVSRKTVMRVKARFVQHGLGDALPRRPATTHRRRVLDGEQEAYLIALACSPAPEGQGRWTLRLLAERVVELGYVESVSHETVRQTLKKTSSSRG